MPSLDWEGCWNARDPGGLPAAAGQVVRPGALIRADSLDGLTDAGWAALVEHGVRTVVDLRNPDEVGPDRAARPADVQTLRLPLDGIEHRDFWDYWQSGPQFATPAYYGPHLERFPERSARVVAAVARARPGGVVVHCMSGRDRTGLVAVLLLALLGTPLEVILADYGLSTERLAVRAAALGEPDPGPELLAWLEREGTSAATLLAAFVARDLAGAMLVGGLEAADVAVLRQRMLTRRLAACSAAG